MTQDSVIYAVRLTPDPLPDNDPGWVFISRQYDILTGRRLMYEYRSRYPVPSMFGELCHEVYADGTFRRVLDMNSDHTGDRE